MKGLGWMSESYKIEYRLVQEDGEFGEWFLLSSSLVYSDLSSARKKIGMEREDDSACGFVYQYRIVGNAVVETDEEPVGREADPDSVSVDLERWDELTGIESRLYA